MCSLVPTAPFYGGRKPKNQEMHYVRSVGMYLEQSTAIVEEALNSKTGSSLSKLYFPSEFCRPCLDLSDKP